MRWRQTRVAVLILAMAGVLAVLLAVPGQTVATKYINDLLIFLDGAYRVTSGQIPHRDFATALGALVYYIPAAGYVLSGSLGGAMPIGVALLLLILAPAMAHIVSSRLQPALALPYAAFLLLIVAVPMNLGEGVTALSFGMFYNRVGWAALALLLVMYVRPERSGSRQDWLDGLSGALLIVLMLFLKVSYGVVAVAFAVLLLLDARHRRWAALALAVTLAVGVIVEVGWGLAGAYLSDVLMAGKVSGALRGSVQKLTDTFLRNLADYVLFVLFVGLALWRTRSMRDLIFYGFCALSGLMIINQNFQTWGIITLSAAAVVAAETLARSDLARRDEAKAWSTSPAAYLLLLAFVLPTIVHCSIALGLHAGLASTRRSGDFALPNLDRIRLVDLWTTGDHNFFATYAATLQDGAHALGNLDSRPGPVVVLDFVNPYSAGLGLPPPTGDSSWHHFGRTFDLTHYPPVEKVFGNARLVMEPKWPVERSTYDGLREVYGAHLADQFELVQETEHWKIYRARDLEADQLAQSPETTTER